MFNKNEISRKDFIKYLFGTLCTFLCIFKLPNFGFTKDNQNNTSSNDDKY